MLLGTVLFDTDAATIKPQYQPLLQRIARYLEEMDISQVRITGHADPRASASYNHALGLRRARSVYEAIAAALAPGMRTRLRVESDPPPSVVATEVRKEATP